MTLKQRINASSGWGVLGYITVLFVAVLGVSWILAGALSENFGSTHVTFERFGVTLHGEVIPVVIPLEKPLEEWERREMAKNIQVWIDTTEAAGHYRIVKGMAVPEHVTRHHRGGIRP